MFILNLWGEIREVFLRLDMVAFSFIDNVYTLFTAIASESLISETIIKQVLNNVYVLVGIFAFFRIALLLINSILNPDALNKQGDGLSKIFVNTVIMLVLLVFTPTLFQMSRDFTSEVVKGNYIQKLFININDSENILEPGREMQRIAIGSVITFDEAVETDSSAQNSNTKKAIQCLNNINGIGEDDDTNEATKLGEGSKECMKKNGVAWGKLADYNGVRTSTSDGGKVYVYNYKPLVLTVAGWTITYVLLSFTFDVAKRMIELAILEIVSPLFVATIVDPKSMQTGPFKKWLKTLGNSYGGLFIRIAAISIMLLCVKLLSYWRPEADIGGIGKLIVLIAFLIFIKQLPKWFSNMLGMDGDGTGLGDLGIGKKIGGAALIGGAATTAGHALTGGARTAVGNAWATHRDNKAKRKQAYKDAGLDREGRREKRRNGRDDYANAHPDSTKFAQWKAGMIASHAAKKEARTTNDAGYGKSIARNLAGMGIGMVEGAKVGAKAENMKGVISSAKGVIGMQNGKSLGLSGKSIGQKVSGVASDVYNNVTDATFGNSTERRKAREARETEQKRSNFVNSAYRNGTLDHSKDGGYNMEASLKQGPFNEFASELDKFGISGKDDVVDTIATLAMHPGCKITGFDAETKTLTFTDGTSEKISGNAGKVFNDAGQANIEQMYMTRGTQILSEREQYSSTIESTQRAINEAIAANTALRAFNVTMPDGGKLDLSFRSIDELGDRMKQAQTIVEKGAPKEDDFKKTVSTKQSDGSVIGVSVVDREAYKAAQIEYQNSVVLINNESMIRRNLEMAENNDTQIQAYQEKIKELQGIIKEQKMDEVVEALAEAVKVDNPYNVEGIREGVSRETSKTSERIKAANKSE